MAALRSRVLNLIAGARHTSRLCRTERIAAGCPDPSRDISEHSYGVRPVNRAGVIRPRCLWGSGVGGESASAVVDVCVATHMRGLVPHDRCAMVRSGAVCLASSVARWGCSQCSLGSLLASLRRCALLAEPLLVAATPSSRVPSSVRRARGRRRPRRSSGACLGPRARASAHGVGGRCSRLELVPPVACRRVCV